MGLLFFARAITRLFSGYVKAVALIKILFSTAFGGARTANLQVLTSVFMGTRSAELGDFFTGTPNALRTPRSSGTQRSLTGTPSTP